MRRVSPTGSGGKHFDNSVIPLQEVDLVITLVLLGPALLLGAGFGVAVRRHPGIDPASAHPSEVVAHEIERGRRSPLAARLDPTTATGLLLTLALIVLVIGGVVL